MGPLLDRFGQAADEARDPRGRPAREQLGASVTFVVLLGPFMVFVPWRNR